MVETEEMARERERDRYRDRYRDTDRVCGRERDWENVSLVETSLAPSTAKL